MTISYITEIMLYFMFLNTVNALVDKYLIKQPIKWKLNMSITLLFTIFYIILTYNY